MTIRAMHRDQSERLHRHSETARLLDLARHEHGGRREETLDQVIVLNMPVARSIALRYSGRGVPDEDLEQVAYLALIRAVHQFDATQDRDLLSYAVPTIRGELRKHFRDRGWMVRPPRGVQDSQLKVLAALDELAEGGGPVAVTDIAERTGESPETVREALVARGCFHPASLDLPLGEDGSGTVMDTRGEVDAGYSTIELRMVLTGAIENLSDRDRSIIYMRFFEDLTQREIGEALGVSQMQVSRLLSRIMRDLRDMLEPAALAA